MCPDIRFTAQKESVSSAPMYLSLTIPRLVVDPMAFMSKTYGTLSPPVP